MNPSFDKAKLALKEFWGYDSFRAGQDDVVRSVLEGKDTLVLFPTGGGKSLCYQVPAMVFEGLTIVISPLIALMQDQVKQLSDRNIPATYINSSLNYREVEQRLVNARNGMYKMLYCAPERLKTELWQAEMDSLPIDLIAIDEAHCISEWGHDFRPSYRDIKESMGEKGKEIRWMALTATATPEVRDDILKNLEFEEPSVISRGFERPNLKWWVIGTNNKREKLIEAVSKASKKGDGLIYGGTRRNCEELADLFAKRGLSAEAYHAGKESETRKGIQERWISGETKLVAATNAFGMGIDKPDCRYVIHDEMPYSMEAYYQEAGRAGRDGAESFPILLYKESDYLRAQTRLTSKYPDRDELEHAYQVICDSLNLAVGSEMEEFVSFDVEMILKRGKLSRSKSEAALRVLNQLGVISLFEDVPPAVALQFSLSAELLSSFKDDCNNPDKAEFTDKLQRLFGNRAHYEEVELREDDVLSALNISRNALIKGLNVLMQHDHILSYTLLKQRSLIKVMESRASALPLSKAKIENHRKVVFQKLEYMHNYILTDTCREVYLRNYFGDTEAEPCGTCDNCLKADAAIVMPIKNEWIQNIMTLLKGSERSVNELIQATDLGMKEISQIIGYLKREGMIEVSPSNPDSYQLVSD